MRSNILGSMSHGRPARAGTGGTPVRRGYVLLMTLALLVLSSTLLVAVGRSAVRHSLDAKLRQDDVQRRWAAASCRAAVLPYAEVILSSIEQDRHRPAAEFRTTLQLGGDRITLVICDEQAKANVNAVIAESGVESAQNKLRLMMSGTGLVNHVHVRPAVDDGLIRGPGQLFDPVDPGPVAGLTWWGDGRLNLMRAGPEAMKAALMPALTGLELDRLIVARDQVMGLSLTGPLPKNMTPAAGADAAGNLLSMAKIDAGVRNRIAVTTRSQCHCVWIIVDDSRRSWVSATASDETPGRQVRTESLAW